MGLSRDIITSRRQSNARIRRRSMGSRVTVWARWLLAGACVAAVIGAVIIYAPGSTPPGPPSRSAPAPDPRLVYTGPYLNIHPDVKYVGDAACADCHFDQHDSFRHHPMGRSMLTLAEANQRAVETPEHNNRFDKIGTKFRVDREGERVWQREYRTDSAGKTIYENSFEVHYVIGSGNHGHSYLNETDGYVVMLPISWYSTKK